MHLLRPPERAEVPISAAHGPEQTVRPYKQSSMRATERLMHTGPGRVELTAVLLSRAVRAENHGIEKGLEGVEGVVMLGHQGFREALEKRGPV
jgi:hypothetical protein